MILESICTLYCIYVGIQSLTSVVKQSKTHGKILLWFFDCFTHTFSDTVK